MICLTCDSLVKEPNMLSLMYRFFLFLFVFRYNEFLEGSKRYHGEFH
jgi:hypothetical protein